MTDAPKLRPYAVAMLFGSAGNANLGLGIVGAMDREHAGAFAVLTHVRENNVSEPLVWMTIMEIDDSVVRQMFNNLKPGEVVNLRPVEQREQVAVDDGIAGRYVPEPSGQGTLAVPSLRDLVPGTPEGEPAA